MSIHALSWAFKIEAMPSSKKFVLVALANFASETGMAYPSVETICRLTCQQDATVRRALDSLVDEKVITDTGKRVGRTQQVKVYRLPEAACESPTNSGGLERPTKDPSKTPARPTKTGGNPVPGTRNQGKKSTSADADGVSDFKVKTAADAEAFAQAPEVYALYPRKVGKPVALKKIAKQIRAHGFEHVRSRTEEFGKAWVGGDLTYCPHPATWFGQERFNDDPRTWTETKREAKNGHHAAPTDAEKKHGPEDWS